MVITETIQKISGPEGQVIGTEADLEDGDWQRVTVKWDDKVKSVVESEYHAPPPEEPTE